LSESDEWSHEQQTVLEALNAGDASPLISYLLTGRRVSATLREAAEARLKEGFFSWKAQVGRVGRPADDVWQSIGFLREKKDMQRSGKLKATDIEYLLAEKHGMSHDNLVKKLKQATSFLKHCASQENGGWASMILNKKRKN